MSILGKKDPKIDKAIKLEAKRELEQIILVASENYASMAVLEASGSILTNKYAEGYPGKRYYGGCQHVDIVESIAIERTKALFGAEHVNVQPHSGSQANMAVYFAVLKPGDTIMGMDLAHGGHLTHGSPVSFSGSLYRTCFYGVDRISGLIDYDKVLSLAKECRPRMIIAGASAYSRVLDFKKFRRIADEVGAYLLVDMAHIAGLVAAGLHPNPIPYADFVTTTTHKTLRGPRGGIIMCRVEYARAIDKAIFPGIQGGPLMHIIAAKAVALKEAGTQSFKRYQAQVVANARALAGAMIKMGFKVISGGTDNHMMLIDLTDKDISGDEAESALEKAGITINKNSVPFDNRPPTKTSGIRLGTPAVTSRGMKEKEMRIIAGLISDVLEDVTDSGVQKRLKKEVGRICRRFPVRID